MLCAKSSCSYGRRWRPQNQGHCIPHCIPTPPMLPLARCLAAAPLSSHAGGGVANSPVLCCAAARAPRFHPQPQQQQQLHQQQQPQPQPQLAVPAGSRRWGTHAAAWKEALGAHTRSISTQQAACMLACAHVCARQCRGSRTLAFSCASSHGCVHAATRLQTCIHRLHERRLMSMHMHTHTRTHTLTRTRMHTHTHALTLTRMRRRSPLRTLMHAHTRVRAQTHAHTHTLVEPHHTRTHTQNSPTPPPRPSRHRSVRAEALGDFQRSGGAQAPAPSPAETARTVLSVCSGGTLATVGEDTTPIGTPVSYTLTKEGVPLLQLAEGGIELTNIARNPRCGWGWGGVGGSADLQALGFGTGATLAWGAGAPCPPAAPCCAWAARCCCRGLVPLLPANARLLSARGRAARAPACVRQAQAQRNGAAPIQEHHGSCASPYSPRTRSSTRAPCPSHAARRARRCSIKVQPAAYPARALASVTLVGKLEGQPVEPGSSTYQLNVEKCLYFGGLDQVGRPGGCACVWGGARACKSACVGMSELRGSGHKHTYVCAHTHAHTHTHEHTHTHTHTHKHACTHARTQAYMHACMHARMHAHTHTRTHMHTHQHMHARTSTGASGDQRGRAASSCA